MRPLTETELDALAIGPMDAGVPRRRFKRDEAEACELSIVVPTRNEAGNVGPLVDLLDAALHGIRYEVIFVDDSDDETPAMVATLRMRPERGIRLIHREAERREGGLGSAVVEGFAIAQAPWICVMDADLQHPPTTVAKLLAQAQANDDDLVVASRFCDTGSTGMLGPVRTALSQASAKAARLVFPRKVRQVSDPMSGFFLIRRDAVDLNTLRPRGFKILLEVLVRSREMRISEVPFHFGERYSGETKASMREGLRFLRHLWELRARAVAERVGRFGAVGASGLALNTALLAVLVEATSMNYILAAILASQGSTLWNFVLTERFVFPGRRWRHSTRRRMLLFFGMNNSFQLVRIPALILLASGLGVNYLLANVATMVLLFVARFAVSDGMIWKHIDGDAPSIDGAWNYDIHGIVTVRSDGRLPELEAFRIEDAIDDPTVRVHLGRPVAPAEGETDIFYSEARGRGFAVRMAIGDTADITASSWLRRSPHVLYTNIVEPVLRWTFVRKGYALVHGACLATNGEAFLLTAKTDTGKTTTILKTLDAYPHTFLSDDLTIVGADGQVMTYPKPLTISRHTLHAVKTPLLTRRERTGLIVQSRLHSKSGRLFGLILAKTRMPAATMNAIVQWVIPPPKFAVQRLVPGVAIAPEAQLVGMAIIQRGGTGDELMDPELALETLMSNCEDAYGFPPYPVIKSQLHGDDLQAAERAIVASALSGLPTTLMRSETMDWASRLPALLDTGRRPEAVADAVAEAIESLDMNGSVAGSNGSNGSGSMTGGAVSVAQVNGSRAS